MTLVDSDILADVLTNDPVWLAWSIESLDQRAAQGPLFVNEVIYAELSVRSGSEDALQRAFGALGVELERTPTEALYLAGKVFGQYRAAGGVRTGVLPDFFIGAHAQVARLPILTRDVGRYRTYFPDVKLIAPQK
jgi:predicted nucleic acid-binding protein